MEELQIITPSFITAAQEIAAKEHQEHADEQLNLLSHEWATQVLYFNYFT